MFDDEYWDNIKEIINYLLINANSFEFLDFILGNIISKYNISSDELEGSIAYYCLVNNLDYVNAILHLREFISLKND